MRFTSPSTGLFKTTSSRRMSYCSAPSEERRRVAQSSLTSGAASASMTQTSKSAYCVHIHGPVNVMMLMPAVLANIVVGTKQRNVV